MKFLFLCFQEKAMAAQREAELKVEEQVLQREEGQLMAQPGKKPHPSLNYLSPRGWVKSTVLCCFFLHGEYPLLFNSFFHITTYDSYEFI